MLTRVRVRLNVICKVSLTAQRIIYMRIGIVCSQWHSSRTGRKVRELCARQKHSFVFSREIGVESVDASFQPTSWIALCLSVVCQILLTVSRLFLLNKAPTPSATGVKYDVGYVWNTYDILSYFSHVDRTFCTIYPFVSPEYSRNQISFRTSPV